MGYQGSSVPSATGAPRRWFGRPRLIVVHCLCTKHAGSVHCLSVGRGSRGRCSSPPTCPRPPPLGRSSSSLLPPLPSSVATRPPWLYSLLVVLKGHCYYCHTKTVAEKLRPANNYYVAGSLCPRTQIGDTQPIGHRVGKRAKTLPLQLHADRLRAREATEEWELAAPPSLQP